MKSSHSILLGVFFVAKLSVIPLQAQFTFTKIADYATTIPNGAGNFASFGTPRAYGANVAFYATGTNGQKGVYLWNGTTLSSVANLSTAVPNGTGNFTNLSFYEQFVTTNGSVLFTGNSASGPGMYKSTAGTLTRIVDTSFTIPGGSDIFNLIGMANEGGGVWAFIGRGPNTPLSVYSYDGANVTAIANRVITLPGSTATLQYTDYVMNNNGTLAFTGYLTNGGQGIYSYAGGALHRIADTTTLIPGTATAFTSFISPPNVNDSFVTFSGGNNTGVNGIYGANSDGTSLVKLVDTSTTAPGVTNTLFAFYNGWSYQSGTLYVNCSETGVSGTGIYAVSNGVASKVIASGDLLDGKTVTFPSLDFYGVGGGTMTVRVQFSDSSSGIYATTLGSGGTGNGGPSFTSQLFASGGFQINLSLTAGQNYRLQGTTNVANTGAWVTLTNITSAPASLQFLDPAAISLPARYYRIISP